MVGSLIFSTLAVAVGLLVCGRLCGAEIGYSYIGVHVLGCVGATHEGASDGGIVPIFHGKTVEVMV